LPRAGLGYPVDVPDWGEFELTGREGLPLESRRIRNAVSLRADAREGNLAMVAAVAIGSAEALELALEPATRLRTIAVEAAGNAIAHAYPDSHGGPLELGIAFEDGGEAARPRVHVRIHDDGVGLMLPPRAGDPPGLGLPILSSLSERFSLISGVDCGTTITATIDAGADPDSPGRRAPPAMAGSCVLAFGDPAFLQPVLGRALAAQLSEERIDVDRLGRAIRTGDVIAAQLESSSPESPALPQIEIMRWPEAQQLRVSIGPLDGAACERLATGVEAGADTVAGIEVAIEPGEGGEATALVKLPV